MKVDKKVYVNCEYAFETKKDPMELEQRISRTVALEILLSASLRYANGIDLNDIVKGNIDIGTDMEQRLKWSYGDECDILYFKVLNAHFEKEQSNPSIQWLCICGSVNDSKYCPICGKEKSYERWICTCEKVNIGKYC